MTPRRLYAVAVLATLAVGGLAFFAVDRTWASVDVASEGLPGSTVAVTGSDAYPLASALALVVVTSALAILAASPRVRRGVGILIVLVSIGAIVSVLADRGGLDDALASAVKKSPAFTSGDPLDGEDRTIWQWPALLAFVLAAALGLVTARRGHTWPTMSSRYDAPAARAAKVTEPTDSDMWRAMDNGEDPTE